TDRAEPLVYGPQFGGHGAAAAELSLAFVSAAGLAGSAGGLPTARRKVAVSRTRGIGPAEMVRNSRTGEVTVDPGSGTVRLDGEVVSAPPAERVSLSRLYFL
ncbi:MAG TPA: hypothetical protein VFN50_01995, partial [Acidimicrobiales bacterium]|nr:hypothetical protein [Acidimicrobiales bacterium]